MKSLTTPFPGTLYHIIASPFLLCSRKALVDIVNSRIGVEIYFSRIHRLKDVALRLKVDPIQPSLLLFDVSFADLLLSHYRTILSIFSPTQDEQQMKSTSVGGFCEQSIETIDSLPDEFVSKKHEKNVESKCAYLLSENTRLQKVIAAYSTQLMDVEKEHEELLVALASYDSELKQLRQQLVLAEQQILISEASSPPSDFLFGDSVKASSTDGQLLEGSINGLQQEIREKSETNIEFLSSAGQDIVSKEEIVESKSSPIPARSPIVEAVISPLIHVAPSRTTHDV